MDTKKIKALQSQLENVLETIEAEFRDDRGHIDSFCHKHLGPILHTYEKVFGCLETAEHMQGDQTRHNFLSVDSALFRTSDNDLLEYLELVGDVKSFILNNEVAVTHPNAWDWRQALRSVLELEGYATGELYERVQLYRSEIEKLRGRAS